MTEVGHRFTPEIALSAKDEVFVDAVRNRVPAIGILKPADAIGRRFDSALALVEIEVDIIPGCHYNVVAHLRGGNAAGHAAPAHHGSRGCETALENLVPTNELFAF